ncbi:hypothetical protein AMJ40_04865 [candidate division TA06 bacterium DG_26]|uniref:Squalene cyclase C-terminal domain-containing protein n=1 Tax=candidate division TA06 bacterium DG_26 TaxID=1703771 RepID=A0A0S7WHY8_UNCT6|nr:MAG: hypothetical protein AMJ40_04865 [candidate division TA06 bacterium DG_26]
MERKLKEFLDTIPINWILSGEPWVRYRALLDIFGKRETDGEVVAARESVRNHILIRRIFEGQNRKGYWGNPDDIYKWFPKKSTTFWILGMLADFGLARDDERIARACEYVFSTQTASGGFGWAPPPTPADCFTGILTESLAKLGYLHDPRLKRAYEWLLRRQRLDGGFWCKKTGLPGAGRQKEPSCAFATLVVLGAFAENPGLKRSKVVRRAVEFLLACWERRGKMKYAGHDSQIGRGWEKLKYPFTDYRILKHLDVLSRFSSTRKDSRMEEMVGVLIDKADEEGRFYAESVHRVWSDFDFSQKERPSRWITLLVHTIVRRIVLPS